MKAYILGIGPINTHANIGAGRLKRISRFDSLAVSAEIQRELDIAVGLIYPDADELFQPSQISLDKAALNDELHIRRIEGRHDDFLVATKRVLGRAAIAAFLEDRVS